MRPVEICFRRVESPTGRVVMAQLYLRGQGPVLQAQAKDCFEAFVYLRQFYKRAIRERTALQTLVAFHPAFTYVDGALKEVL